MIPSPSLRLSKPLVFRLVSETTKSVGITWKQTNGTSAFLSKSPANFYTFIIYRLLGNSNQCWDQVRPHSRLIVFQEKICLFGAAECGQQDRQYTHFCGDDNVSMYACMYGWTYVKKARRYVGMHAYVHVTAYSHISIFINIYAFRFTYTHPKIDKELPKTTNF